MSALADSSFLLGRLLRPNFELRTPLRGSIEASAWTFLSSLPKPRRQSLHAERTCALRGTLVIDHSSA